MEEKDDEFEIVLLYMEVMKEVNRAHGCLILMQATIYVGKGDCTWILMTQ